MRQLIDIKVPTCWQQLSDKQLRFVFKLLNGIPKKTAELYSPEIFLNKKCDKGYWF